jgi:hypothetical protein
MPIGLFQFPFSMKWPFNLSRRLLSCSLNKQDLKVRVDGKLIKLLNYFI